MWVFKRVVQNPLLYCDDFMMIYNCSDLQQGKLSYDNNSLLRCDEALIRYQHRIKEQRIDPDNWYIKNKETHTMRSVSVL